MPAEVRRAPATAKINLALVVGERRPDGLHEVTTVLQRVDLADRVSVAPAPRRAGHGLRRRHARPRARSRRSASAPESAGWHAHLAKQSPSRPGSAAAAPTRRPRFALANETLAIRSPPEALAEVAARLGSDVPFFLTSGPQLGEGSGTSLRPLDLPADYWIVLVLPRDAAKASTAAVYEEFDRRDGAAGATSAARPSSTRSRRHHRGRPRRPAAERPRELPALARAARARRLPGRRQRRRPHRLRAVPGRAPSASPRARRSRAAGRTWLTVPAWYG